MKIMNKVRVLTLLIIASQFTLVKPEISSEAKIGAGLLTFLAAKYGLETAQIQQLDKNTVESLQVSANCGAASKGLNLAAIAAALGIAIDNGFLINKEYDERTAPYYIPPRKPYHSNEIAFAALILTPFLTNSFVDIYRSTVKKLKNKDAIVEYRVNRSPEEDQEIAKQKKKQQIWLTLNYVLALGLCAASHFGYERFLQYSTNRLPKVMNDANWDLTLQVGMPAILLAAAYISEQIRSYKLAKLELKTQADVPADELVEATAENTENTQVASPATVPAMQGDLQPAKSE